MYLYIYSDDYLSELIAIILINYSFSEKKNGLEVSRFYTSVIAISMKGLKRRNNIKQN